MGEKLGFYSTQMMRAYCKDCHYPEKTCICKYIETIISPCELYLLQHPKEAVHKKNTARLVPLSVKQAHIHIGITEPQFNAVAQRVQGRRCALIYPNQKSKPLESVPAQSPQPQLPEILFFLDGSWKQAHSLYLSNPWLHAMPHFHFEHATQSCYTIRHTQLTHSLSTLEAVAYSLKCLFNTNVQPLYTLQQALLENWQGPREHRR